MCCWKTSLLRRGRSAPLAACDAPDARKGARSGRIPALTCNYVRSRSARHLSMTHHVEGAIEYLDGCLDGGWWSRGSAT